LPSADTPPRPGLARWPFLLGREKALRLIAAAGPPSRVLEVGCGAGRNVRRLARLLPRAEILGLDACGPRLRRALWATAPYADRVTLVRARYSPAEARWRGWPDAVLFSYALSVDGADRDAAIAAARRDLRPGGIVAAVDFHAAACPALDRLLARAHGRADGGILPALASSFRPIVRQVRRAWLGAWEYFIFLGAKE